MHVSTEQMAQLVFELIECTKVRETFRRRLAENQSECRRRSSRPLSRVRRIQIVAD